jgi:hypothetical protein
MALVEYIALVKQIDFDYLYTGTPHTLIKQSHHPEKRHTRDIDI